MSTKKKLLQAAAGSAGGAGLNVEDVFSTYLYTGNDTSQTITNGIDLSGEGGMTWLKTRNDTHSHYLFDTERGAGYYLNSDTTGAQAYHATAWVTAFNSDGFDIGYSVAINDDVNDHASWTFRKAPKFFDVVTYTGTGSATTISHNLGSVPGCIIVKRTDSTENWKVYHRAIHPTNNGSGYVINLNLTNARAATTIWSSTEPTSTEFSISGSSTVNASGGTYVAYLFAHNDGDGEFGPNGDADIIKCGSFTTDGSGNATVNLGWEPQFVLWKISNYSADWNIYDSMRGFVASTSGGQRLRPNTSGAEGSHNQVRPSATGFDGVGVGGGGAAYNVIYIAIRRGPMAVPESATDVFQVGTVQNNTPKDVSPAPDFPVDFVLHHAAANSSAGNKLAINRLATDLLYTNLSGGAYGNYSSYSPFDHMDNVQLTGLGAANGAAWMWRRAPNYFDVVAYTGNGTAGRTVSHNLGVAPEMIWVKARTGSGREWTVWHKDTGGNGWLRLNTTDSLITGIEFRFGNNSTYVAPTDTEFTVGSLATVNASSDNYIAYLFASLDGVSKVGSFTYSGTTLNVDCGFTTGARFVLYKRYNTTGSWLVLDTERGINASANDPVLYLNATDAEDSGYNLIEPYSAGFTISGNDVGNGDYIFYAIA